MRSSPQKNLLELRTDSEPTQTSPKRTHSTRHTRPTDNRPTSKAVMVVNQKPILYPLSRIPPNRIIRTAASKMKRTTAVMLAALTLTATSATAIRGDRKANKKQDEQELQRLNKERKRLDKERKRYKKQGSKTNYDIKEWKDLTKEEKKQLLKDEDRLDGGGASSASVKPHQLAYLHQYFNGMTLNSATDQDDPDVQWKDLSKEEKKRVKQMMDQDLQFNDEMGMNSAGTDKDEDNDGSLENDATDFVIHNRPKPGTLTVDDILGNAKPSNKPSQKPSRKPRPNKIETSEDDMGQNSQQDEEFILPMPSLTFGGNKDEEQTVSSNANTFFASVDEIIQSSEEVNPAIPPSKLCPKCFTFSKQIIDPSIQLDSFDTTSLDYTMSGIGWNTETDGCYEGSSCIISGITSSPDHDGQPVYSNLTLSLDESFEGGVLSFQLMIEDNVLVMPNEAFYVSVDDHVQISSMPFQDGWSEYSIGVGRGRHKITWSHVYNPLGLESLPARNKGGAILMDDLRYSPFDPSKDQDFDDNKKAKRILMTTDGWEIDEEKSNYSILASTKDIKQESGVSNVNFVLYSENGGTLKYKISTSTTAPHDDFVILLNGKPSDAVFGLMPSFTDMELDIPSGKVAVTFQHRKNPGGLSQNVLKVLGDARTKGFTRVDEVRFVLR